MPRTTPCLWFDDQAEEAAHFYVSVFPNSRVGTVVRYGPSGPGADGSVMLVDFELDGTRYTALNGGPLFHFDEAVSFQIDCADQRELDHYWTTLGEGGQEGPCGWLKDRFGLSWQVVPRLLGEVAQRGDAAASDRIMRSVLTMGKIDIAELERAARG